MNAQLELGLPVSQVSAALPAAAALLTPRELQIARLVTLGRRNAAIAQELGISVVTVKNHLGRVYRKLNLEGRMQVMLWVLAQEAKAAA